MMDEAWFNAACRTMMKNPTLTALADAMMHMMLDSAATAGDLLAAVPLADEMCRRKRMMDAMYRVDPIVVPPAEGRKP